MDWTTPVYDPLGVWMQDTLVFGIHPASLVTRGLELSHPEVKMDWTMPEYDPLGVWMQDTLVFGIHPASHL
jgi:hypothetical protein